MKAVVWGMGEEQEDAWSCEEGQTIEILGFVDGGIASPHVVWADDEGSIRSMPAHFVRLQAAI